MALVTAIGDAAADSYIDLAAADAYVANDRLFPETWDALTDPQKEAALKMATRTLERLDYVGDRVSTEQRLEWPRWNAYWPDGRAIPSDEIPLQLQQAQVELAIWSAAADRTKPADGEEFSRIKVGEIEMDLRNPTGRAGSVLESMPDQVVGLLQGLTSSSVRSNSVPLVR